MRVILIGVPRACDVRPMRKPEMVPNWPSCQMWNASLYTLVRRSRSSVAAVRSICALARWPPECSEQRGKLPQRDTLK